VLILNSFSSSSITSKTNITQQTSVHLFQSLSNKYFQLILIIQYHIKNEHYSTDFCSPLSITFKQIFSTHFHHPTSHQKRTLLKTLLFTSFNHFQTNIFNSFSSSNITSKTNITQNTSVHLFQSLSNKYFQLILVIQYHIKNEHYSSDFCSPLSITFKQIFSTLSHHPTSHQKRTLLTRLLFTSFNHFRTNIFNSFSSSNITSKTNITHQTSVHLFQSLSNKYFQLFLIIQHRIKNEHYSRDFCSPLSITFEQIFSTHSHHPTSHQKRTLLITLLFTSFNHFQTNIFNSFSSSNIKNEHYS